MMRGNIIICYLKITKYFINHDEEIRYVRERALGRL